MNFIEINKTFKSLKECEQWQQEHLEEYTQGKTIFTIMHEASTIIGEVILKGVYVICTNN